MTPSNLATATAETISAETMRFLTQLGADVAGPTIDLPSYPQAALRVQRVLSDVGAGAERVVRVIGAEPVLASRVLAMANSAALSRGGAPVVELRAAVQRLGFDTLRSAAISFAVAQLRRAAEYRIIEKPMTQLWQRSIGVAAMCHVLAHRLGRFQPDVALLAGLVSGIGRLYILTHSTQYPALFRDPAGYHELEQQWHSQIGRGILENWHMSDEIIEAVGEVEEAAIDDRHRASLADLLSVAKLLHDLRDSPDVLAARLAGHRGAQRLGLSAADSMALIGESAAEVAALREALGR